MDNGAPSILDARAAEELAALRRRAYGPDADIASDSAALARLAELEAAGRPPAPTPEPAASVTAPPPLRVAGDPSASGAAPRSEPSARREPLVLSEPIVVVETAEPPASSVRETTRTSRLPASVAAFVRRRWLAILAAVVAVAALVLTVNLVTQPRADATLVRAASDDRTPDIIMDPSYLQYLRVDEGEFVPYEDYYGLRPWVAPRTGGGWCLAIALDNDVYQATCAPESLRPIADVMIEADYPIVPDLDLPPGSVVRFELRGDVVDVRVAEQAPVPTS